MFWKGYAHIAQLCTGIHHCCSLSHVLFYFPHRFPSLRLFFYYSTTTVINTLKKSKSYPISVPCDTRLRGTVWNPRLIAKSTLNTEVILFSNWSVINVDDSWYHTFHWLQICRTYAKRFAKIRPDMHKYAKICKICKYDQNMQKICILCRVYILQKYA